MDEPLQELSLRPEIDTDSISTWDPLTPANLPVLELLTR